MGATIISLNMCLLLFGIIIDLIFGDEFFEKLLVRPINPEQIVVHFVFEIRSSELNADNKNVILFPGNLKDILMKHPLHSFRHSITRGIWNSEEWGDFLSTGADGSECTMILSPLVYGEEEYMKRYLLPFFHSSLSSFPLTCTQPLGSEDEFCRSYNSREILCDDNIRSFVSLLPGGARSPKGFN
jgi:hypothetical protein